MKDKLQLILGAIALIGIGIGIGTILILILQRSGLQPREVVVGPVSYEIPTSQPQTPVVELGVPTSTSLPQGPSFQSLGTIRVFGNSNQGVQIQIPQSGIYRFAYRSGSYSTYPIGYVPENIRPWRTAIFIFRGDRALWDETIIRKESALLWLADMGDRDSAEDAEEAAQSEYVEIPLNQGEMLTLIAVDGFDAYADNPGQVVVEWFVVWY